ncbi:hypothetical protein BKA70DRAFT_1226878 [Coprinopsis sp. MPI-PUGE-AT-0042]|nr:hypothetical protein BKA70DRAFT_1226878 [Coprinopsis sp. MPI-PUGE-AT-0042]
MPSNSGPRFIVTPFLPKELAELLKVPLDTLIASYRKPSPTTPNNKGKKKKKKKSGTGAPEREPVVDGAALAAAAQELLSASIKSQRERRAAPINKGYDSTLPPRPFDSGEASPLPSIPTSKRPPTTRVTVEEVPDEAEATYTKPASPPPRAPATPTRAAAAAAFAKAFPPPAPPPPGPPYFEFNGMPRLPPFDTYPPPSIDFLQNEAYQALKADRLSRLYKAEVNATFGSDGSFNPQPGSIIHKLLEEMRGAGREEEAKRRLREMKEEVRERRRREEEMLQQQQQKAWPTDTVEDDGGCWCSKCGCRTGQYGAEGEGIVN